MPRFHKTLRGMCCAAIVMLASQPAFAQPSKFNFYITNLRVAEALIDWGIEDGRYQAKARIRSAGLGGVFFTLKMTVESRGVLRDDGSLQPVEYTLESAADNYQRSAKMVYQDGVPDVVYDRVEREHSSRYGGDPVPAQSQKGTVDALTALVELARPTPPETVCDRLVTIYDGRRVTTVELNPPVKISAAGVKTCAGKYVRISGYTAEELERQAEFPFEVRLGDMPDGTLRVDEVIGELFVGTGRLRRIE